MRIQRSQFRRNPRQLPSHHAIMEQFLSNLLKDECNRHSCRVAIVVPDNAKSTCAIESKTRNKLRRRRRRSEDGTTAHQEKRWETCETDQSLIVVNELRIPRRNNSPRPRRRELCDEKSTAQRSRSVVRLLPSMASPTLLQDGNTMKRGSALKCSPPSNFKRAEVLAQIHC